MVKKEEIIEEIPFRFKTSGNIIKKLGEESIANKNIAILELIKNSYDARASKVEVRLEKINTNEAFIVISDNGDGMTNTDLEHKWLNIATSNKSERIHKAGDRIAVGEKGIGRLSSESLGDQTILTTYPRQENTGYQILFDWTKYQKKDVLVDQVINEGGKFKKKKAESGTRLTISKLRHDWNDVESQKLLLKDLYLLHPPNAKPKNFNVNASFSIPGLKKIDKNFLLSAAYHLKVSLISGSLLKYEIKCITGKRQKGQIPLTKKLLCGDAVLELFVYYRDTTINKNLNLNIPSQKIKDTVKILDEYCGVKIYRDSFRVKPYGEKDNDWLGLDADFQNNSMLPRNSNVFGFVNISKLKNPKIADTTTREGIVHTPEFQDLISFVKTAIRQIFFSFRSEIESSKKKAKKKQSKAKKVTPVVVSAASKSIATEKLIANIGGAYPQSFYVQLESEINDCYKNNFPNASFFLSRKLIENLIFNILEKKYSTDINLWYSTSTNSHLKLSQLISNLYSKKGDFKPNVQSYIDKFHTEIGSFRKEANSKAHNIFEYLNDKSELKKFRISDLIQLLLNIYQHM